MALIYRSRTSFFRQLVGEELDDSLSFSSFSQRLEREHGLLLGQKNKEQARF
jgi:hypothetical protein